MFSAAFINKINFGFTYLFICLFPCNEIVMKIDVWIFLQRMDMILIYVICGNIENLPNRESFSSPKFQLDKKKTWNHATWLHDEWEISYLEIRLIRWKSVKWKTRRSSTQSCVLIKSTIRVTMIFVMIY